MFESLLRVIGTTSRDHAWLAIIGKLEAPSSKFSRRRPSSDVLRLQHISAQGAVIGTSQRESSDQPQAEGRAGITHAARNMCHDSDNMLRITICSGQNNFFKDRSLSMVEDKNKAYI